MRGEPVVGDLKIDPVVLVETGGPRVDRPLAAFDLQHAATAVENDVVGFAALLNGRSVERNRHAAAEAAEARIGDEASLGQIDYHNHVAARRLVRREYERYARGAQRRLEPERAQRGVEQRRLLEAIAPAPPAHDFVLQAFNVEPDRSAEQDVDVLKMYGSHVRCEQAGERGAVGLERAIVGYSGEIGGEVEGGHGELAMGAGAQKNRRSPDALDGMMRKAGLLGKAEDGRSRRRRDMFTRGEFEPN